MNERIKELAIQAGFFYEDYKDIWYLEYHNQSCEEEMKKFAELIVKECASIVYNTCNDGDIGAQSILYEFDIDGARSQK
jgi:hypothetical protein